MKIWPELVNHRCSTVKCFIKSVYQIRIKNCIARVVMHINKHLLEISRIKGNCSCSIGFTITYWDFHGCSLSLFSCNKQEIICRRKDFVEVTTWIENFGVVTEKKRRLIYQSYRNFDVVEVQIMDIYLESLIWLVIFCTLHAYASIKTCSN